MEKQFNLSVIPTHTPGKNPTISSWNNYQNYCAPINIWDEWYKSGKGVGIICGNVSGHLECIDIDIKNDPQKTIINEYRSLIPDDLYNKLVVQTTPSGGQHYIYRCPEATIEKNLKLCYHSDRTIIIETRGEGGYFCTNKQKNKIIQGVLDLENLNEEIQPITPSERMFLLDSARALNRHFESPKLNEDGTAFKYKEERINKFNAEYPDILKVFAEAQWKVVHDDGEKVSILRPGSTALHSGYYFKESKIFYCFSSSTVFKENQPHNHFQILQKLKGNDDYRTTLNLLTGLGYAATTEAHSGENTQRAPRTTHDDIIKYISDNGIYYDTFIQEVMKGGKVFENMDSNSLYIKMTRDFNRVVNKHMYEDSLNSRDIPQFNPLLEFIEKYKDNQSTGNFEKWFDCLELREESQRETLIYFFRKWYVGLIAQALGGEYPNDFFISLLSLKHGVGKTTLLRGHTLPKELQKYVVVKPLNIDDDYRLATGQNLLIINDEMDGISYKDEKTLKSLLSTGVHPIRRKYDRRITNIVRRCSFCGSGNELSVIKEMGNRRIIPIEVINIDWKKINNINTIDLFMEAYNLYMSGETYTYVQGDEKALYNLNIEHHVESDLDSIISEYIDIPENEEDTHEIKLLDLQAALKAERPNESRLLYTNVIGRALKQRGFESRRVGVKKETVYLISEDSKILSIIKDADRAFLLGEVHPNRIN